MLTVKSDALRLLDRKDKCLSMPYARLFIGSSQKGIRIDVHHTAVITTEKVAFLRGIRVCF